MGYAYDQSFMSFTAQSSDYAARRIVPILQDVAAPRSVLDVGCAKGTWLRVWSDAGVEDFHGLDGDYVQRSSLEIPEAHFHAHDLTSPADLGRQFDFVQSLEVAEHLPESSSEIFIETIVRHSRGIVLFSAAVPGQGGEYHVNEQPLSFWRELFRQHHYQAFDPIRPKIAEDSRISFWYRYNLLLYVHESRISSLPETVAATRIPENREIPDVSPTLFQIRKALIRRMPYRVQHELARLKARITPLANR